MDLAAQNLLIFYQMVTFKNEQFIQIQKSRSSFRFLRKIGSDYIVLGAPADIFFARGSITHYPLAIVAFPCKLRQPITFAISTGQSPKPGLFGGLELFVGPLKPFWSLLA